MFLSKLYRATSALREAVPKRLVPGLVPRALRLALGAPSRGMTSIIPRNQYENNIRPKKFQLGYALIHHWEIIPLFLVVAFDMIFCLCGSLYVSLLHRVDTQFSGHNWNCISRNMDLRNPTIHKNIVYYQRYEPWPEMQDVLDKMRNAERRLRTRVDTCGKA